MRQGVRLEPLLRAISDFLDDHQEIVERARRDLVRGLRKPESGRRGLTPQQVLRSFVLKRVKNWDYRELRERIADGMTLRQFTDFHCQRVPKRQAFHRDFNRLTPDTLRVINDVVVQTAVDRGLEDGSKLRVHTTVVETDIHHPTDNTLLWDVVRVITRTVGHLAEAMNLRRFKAFCDHTRAARRRMQDIQRMTTKQRQVQQMQAYASLIAIAEEVVESAQVVLENTGRANGKDMLADLDVASIREEIAHYCDLGSRVVRGYFPGPLS